MKIKLVGILLFINCSICFGQIDTTMVPFVSYWSNGDSYNYKITKLKENWRENELREIDSTSYLVNFKVIDSTESSYKINWSFETRLGDYEIPSDMVDVFSKYLITEVIYETTELGEFVGIENWKEISSMMKELFTEVFEGLAEGDEATKEKLTKAMGPILSIYESKESIEELLFKELRYFHFPFGLEYSVDEVIEYEDLLPNMLGGDPIRGESKLYFEEVDFDNSYSVMIQEMKLNPDDTKAIVVSIFERMGLEDDELTEALRTAKFDITDYNRYAYYFYPGIPIKIETNRETTINMGPENGKRVEKIIIELVD